MKQLLIILLLLATLVGAAAAETQPTMIFSQDVVAINPDGSLYPSVNIDPHSLGGMQTHDFELGKERILRIQTNLRDAEERGLENVATTIKRCYSYIEKMTSKQLKHGVLLYLVELDTLPMAYSFKASYHDTSQWEEVRLVLIERDTPLIGENASSNLNDLLYDTLPHELGHDIFDTMPHLLHDIDGGAIHHTRWFQEGVCEVLAKGFSHREAPHLYRRYLALRHVGTVLTEPRMQTSLLNWQQNNQNDIVLESDLYGAAMLVLMAWTEFIPLDELLDHIEKSDGQINGADLVAMLQKTTGISLQDMMARANYHGRQLNETIVLAMLD